MKSVEDVFREWKQVVWREYVNDTIKKVLGSVDVVVGRVYPDKMLFDVHLPLSSNTLFERLQKLTGGKLRAAMSRPGVVCLSYLPEERQWVENLIITVPDDVWEEWLPVVSEDSHTRTV